MKAIVMAQSGEPSVLQMSQIDPPEVTDAHQVLVRIKAAGVNPIDTKLRSNGTYYPDQMPAVLGCDGAGVVEAVGDKVSAFKPGDAVYYCRGGMGGPQGNYAEQNVVDSRFIAHKPRELDFEQAAAAPLVLITAWEALHDRAGIKAGQKVLIHAGAGGVGHVAIQLAKIAGCEVMTTVSSSDKTEYVRSLGADMVVNYTEDNVVEAAKSWGNGVDVVFDTVGGQVFEQSLQAVRPYGHVVSLLQPQDIDWKQARLNNITTSLELMLSPMYFGWEDAERHQAWILQQCAELFDQGKLQITLSDTLSLDQAAEAHRRIEAGGMQGKLVLLVEQTNSHD